MRRNRDKNYILYILLDRKKHTISEIAEKRKLVIQQHKDTLPNFLQYTQLK